MTDLITILGDEEESYKSIDVITDHHIETMARHWRSDAGRDELTRQIMALRLVYDWPALKAIVGICPGIRAESFKINDLFNVMDMHVPLGHGFRAENQMFLDSRRLIGAKACLKMLLLTMFYIDYQVAISQKSEEIKKHYMFAEALARRMQKRGMEFSENFETPEFIRGDVSFVSLNYDPIGLWMQFIANRTLNNSPAVPHVGTPAARLQIFHDMGHFIPARRVDPRRRPSLWYPMNEAAAQRLNESNTTQRVRLSKFLFPHGNLCWRECPDCGKLSAYFGDEWEILSACPFPPPPLKGFETRAVDLDLDSLCESDRAQRQKEIEARTRGQVDARACLHCGTLTYCHHTQTVMQSSFKQTPPSFIDEIQRDLRSVVMQADHIILMGYSLPIDDVTYRSFFAARQQRSNSNTGASKIRCTVVGLCDKHPGWVAPHDLKRGTYPEGTPVRSALDIFGEDNVRFYGGGIPNVLLDGSGAVSAQRVDDLLTWTET